MKGQFEGGGVYIIPTLKYNYILLQFVKDNNKQ